MAKLTKKQAKAAKQAEKEIEKLDSEGSNIADMNPTEIKKVISAMSAEGLKLRRNRKKIRYQLYRLRTDAEGKGAHESTPAFVKIFEDQPLFDGWGNFGTSWDVAFDDAERIVHKHRSEQEEWDEIVRAKFPTVDHEGRVSYPDVTVRKKVEAEDNKRSKSIKKKK